MQDVISDSKTYGINYESPVLVSGVNPLDNSEDTVDCKREDPGKAVKFLGTI